MTHKEKVRTGLADALEAIEQGKDGTTKIAALTAVYDIVLEFKHELELSIGEQDALINMKEPIKFENL